MKSLEEKIDKLDEKIDKISETLVRNTVSLEQHEYRTTLAEQRLGHVENDLKPIKDHVTFVKNAMKLLALVGSILLFCKQMGWM